MNETIMLIPEFLGTIAFAISGALIGISCNLDIFGVFFIGITTAVGGGIIRDIIIGNTPPAIFMNPFMLFVAAITSLIVFVIAYINRKHFDVLKERIGRINNIYDAVGLSAFTVTGTEIACSAGVFDSILPAVCMGMITGVGGGIIRDILTSRIPDVLKKHIYALASIFGSIVYYIIRMQTGDKVTATLVAMILIFVVRMLATKYLWELPKININ